MSITMENLEAFLSPQLRATLETPEGFYPPLRAQLREDGWKAILWKKSEEVTTFYVQPKLLPIVGAYLPEPTWVRSDGYEYTPMLGMLTTAENAAVRIQTFAAQLGGRFFTDAQIREIEQTAAQGGCYLKL